MTKAEFYKSLIEIQKKSGQGLSGIVRIKSSEISRYLDELIEEGLVECYNDGGTMGHPDSNRWYIPTKGYNVWKDGIENGEGDTSFLKCVRLYLGQIEDKEEGERENIQKWLNPSAEILLRNPGFMKIYSEWLTRNSEQLEIMLNLDDFYPGSGNVVTFTEEESEYIKSRAWYKDNKTIKECLNISEEVISDRKQIISLTYNLISLYKQKGNSVKEIKENTEKIEESEKEITFRKKLHRWFNEQDMNYNIQDVFGKEKETV